MFRIAIVLVLLVTQVPAAHAGWFKDTFVKPIEKGFDQLEEELKETMTGTDRQDEVDKVRARFADARQKLSVERANASSQFDGAITEMRANLERLEYMGIDPTRVRGEDGTLSDMVAQVAALEKTRNTTLAKLDAQLAQMDQQEAEAVRKVNASYD